MRTACARCGRNRLNSSQRYSSQIKDILDIRLLENRAAFCWSLFCFGHINNLITCCILVWNKLKSCVTFHAMPILASYLSRLLMPRLSKNMLCKHNFKTIWCSGSFWNFCSPKRYKPSFAGFFCRKWPPFPVKVWTLDQKLWHLYKYHINAENYIFLVF